MIACDGLFSSVLWRVVERDVNWAAAQLDWPTLSSREVFVFVFVFVSEVFVFVFVFVFVLWGESGKKELTLNWADAQLDWPTLSSREVFSATKKHIFSAEILIADIAAHVAFRQQTSLLRDTKESMAGRRKTCASQ